MAGDEVCYVDASAVLSLLLGDRNRAAAERMWMAAPIRCSSRLLELECLTVLRRCHRHQHGALPRNWLHERRKALQTLLADVSLLALNEAVIEVFHDEERLGGCRTLDAVHLATALVFQRDGEAKVRLLSFDQEMRAAAETVGIAAI